MIVHIHIPKNGGTTFNKILQRRFKSAYVPLYSVKPGYFFSEAELIEWMESHQKDIKAISSHSVRYPLPDLPMVKYNYITFLRDPVERVLSLYFHEKKITAATDVDHCSHQPFEDYLDIRLEHDNALSNWQTYHIHESGDLIRAKEVLERFKFVGIVENYNASLTLLSHKLAWPLGSMMHIRQNVNKSVTAREYLTSQVYRRVARLNEADIELHQFANNLLETEIRSKNRFFSFRVRYLKYTNQTIHAALRMRRFVSK